MVAVHSFTGGPHWGIDLLATGLIGGAIYYLVLLFFGLTPEEKQRRSEARRPIHGP